MRLPWRDQYHLSKKSRAAFEIGPDEIFADSSNLPDFDTDQFEGRVERPLTRRVFFFVGLSTALLLSAYALQAVKLQIVHGEELSQRAENNQLQRNVIFADRGIITDRAGRTLASNIQKEGEEFSSRMYADYRGIAHAVGYAKSPAHDTKGVFFRQESAGVDGVEAAFNDTLAGHNGAQLTETDVRGKVVTESTLVHQQNGQPLTLSIDANLSQGLFDAIAARAHSSGFQGGAGVIMDVNTGELLALVSYPEFNLQTLADGADTQKIGALFADKSLPFLDRAVGGLYTPGSIVKPVMALGALTEGVVDEHTSILSTGSISLPNPYNPDSPSIFKDWKAHGWVDVRRAIAVSSDVYFYEVGGGFESQRGIGIDNIDKYFRMFGFGSETGLPGFSESTGVIPTPSWKESVFPDDPTWRVGDTYHTVIGQYGVTVTPLQVARAVAAIANGGKLLTPSLLASTTPSYISLPISPYNFTVVHEGMRECVTDGGTAAALNLPFIDIAAKTGTAQLGTKNQYMNSWVVGFWPYENPKYSFAIVLEKAPAGTLYGAPAAGADFFTWMRDNAGEYLNK